MAKSRARRINAKREHCSRTKSDQIHKDTSNRREQLRTALSRLRSYLDDGNATTLNNCKALDHISKTFDHFRSLLNQRESKLKEEIRLHHEAQEVFLLRAREELRQKVADSENILNILDTSSSNTNEELAKEYGDLLVQLELHKNFPNEGCACVFYPGDCNMADTIRQYGTIDREPKLEAVEPSTTRKRRCTCLVGLNFTAVIITIMIAVFVLWYGCKHREYANYKYVSHRVLNTQPYDMECSKGGRLLVSGANGIVGFDNTLQERKLLVSDSYTTRMTTDHVGGIYAAVRNSAVIRMFDPEGHHQHDISLRDDPYLQISPFGMATGANGLLYVARKLLHESLFTVEVYTTGGRFVKVLIKEKSLPKLDLYEVYRISMSVDSSGNIAIADLCGLSVYTPEGAVIETRDRDSGAPFQSSNDLVGDEFGQYLIADWKGQRLVVLLHNMTLVGYVTDGRIERPTRIALCPDGQLYVYDIELERIVVLDI
ncbi:hypothetical protein LSH36_924g00025 [Paralvinella palmiformis]|uniref:Uncharacterized protein n=1 Tax=Paralvinella palmiformis TaxID=53620 RepID=A0AAD9IY48_9ANNE|nr:hypothetical protein LSH36_924g00025 [Paralvinella palmiformis]